MIPTVFAVDDEGHELAFIARPDCQLTIAADPVRVITLAEDVDRLDFRAANYNMTGMTGVEMVVRICHVWPQVKELLGHGIRRRADGRTPFQSV